MLETIPQKISNNIVQRNDTALTKTNDHQKQNDHNMVNFGKSMLENDTNTGFPLDASTRSFMESRFSFDFSKVRIYTDIKSEQKTSSLNAYAFTVGNDIFFGKNQFNPSSEKGAGLLAHELTHVIQQSNGTHTTLMQNQSVESGSHLEYEADTAALSVLHGNQAKVKNRVSQSPIQKSDWGSWLLEKLPIVSKLKSTFGKAGDVIGIMIDDPIKFLSNLLTSVKGGFNQFVDNITTHLKAGLMSWLFGTMESAGITIPKTFDLKSLLGLVLHILGLTYDKLRQKAVNLIGEKNVSMIEKVWNYISTLIKEGPIGLWDMLKENISDAITTTLDSIKEWVITTIIKKAVVKLVSMFNPAGAIVQALISIYDTVTFVVERMKQIQAVVDTVLNSMDKIAHGNTKEASDWVEKSLAGIIPVVIGFLANFIGLGGITDKIKSNIQNIQGKVDGSIDKVIAKIVGLFAKKTTSEKEEDTSPEKQQRWTQGHAEIDQLKEEAKSKPLEEEYLIIRLADIKQKYHFTKLAHHREGDKWIVTSAMSPETNDEMKAPHLEETQISYSGGEGGFGGTMIADPLTANGTAGTAPTSGDMGNSHYAKLNLRKKGNGSYYVKGHLLNQKLHGPGNIWENLTPLSRKGNSAHERMVESIIKKLVNDDPKHTLRYKVTAIYTRGENSGLIEKIKKENTNQDTKNKKIEIVKAEQYVPEKLEIEAKDKKTNQSVSNVAPSVPNIIEQEDPTDYEL